MKIAKNILMWICLVTFALLIVFGDLFQPEPSLTTIMLLVIGWLAFCVLLILRLTSFLKSLRRSS